MRIGELCRQASVSRDTVRYYEKMGLLETPTQPDITNTYKHYSATALQRLRLIVHAKALGFTLAEIRDVIDIWDGPDFDSAQKVACLERKLQELDEKSQALNALRAGLLNALEKAGGPCTDR